MNSDLPASNVSGAPRQDPTTRDSLLDAAEDLFAQQGFDAVSVRAITKLARANLAAVSYYFGSKEGLLLACHGRHIRPMNEERMRRLRELQSGATPPTIEEILDAFLRPVVKVLESLGKRGRHVLRLAARFAFGGESVAEPIFEREFLPVLRAFGDALAASAPGLPQRSMPIVWMNVVGGLLLGTFQRDRLSKLAGLDLPGSEAILQAAIAYHAAGIRALCAPASPTPA